MIDIALVGPVSPYKGGIAHFNTRLLRALDGRASVLAIGWQPLSLRRLRGPWLEPGLDDRPDGNPAVRLDFVDPRTWSSAVGLLRDARPSRVVLHWVNLICAPAYLALMRASRGIGSSNELIVHNAISHESRLLGRVATRVMLRSADRAITHSQWDAQLLRRWRPGMRVDAAFHPIYDSLRSLGASRTTPGLLEEVERPVLLFFGFIRPYKGLDLLIRALPRVLRRWPSATLVIAGEPAMGGRRQRDATRTLRLVRELGLDDRVRIDARYIPLEEVGAYFTAADLIVLPYRAVSQSGVMQVAYAFDRPVVATRVGGLPEMIEDGVSGRLADPEDPGSLADAILRCLESPPDPEQIRKYAARFSWDRYVEILLQGPAP